MGWGEARHFLCIGGVLEPPHFTVLLTLLCLYRTTLSKTKNVFPSGIHLLKVAVGLLRVGNGVV